MARRSFLRIAGVIENMSTFTCEHGTNYPLFGSGGGQNLATEIGSELLGQIPIESDVSHGSDNGEPVAIAGAGLAAEVFRDIAKKIISQTVPVNEMAGCSARMLESVALALGEKPSKK
jgi:ATP-binding protein involved in chromosome partitioning